MSNQRDFYSSAHDERNIVLEVSPAPKNEPSPMRDPLTFNHKNEPTAQPPDAPAASRRQEMQQQKKMDFYKEMDHSMDIQLHPLKDSTWTEILPFMKYLPFNSQATQDTLEMRESRS